jgi:hypothetical protein
MYLPWMGYFGMIDQADVFVYYDDVQFVRRSWQRRNKIKIPQGDFTWLTVPIEKEFGQDIADVKIKTESDWREQHWKSITHSYASTAHFNEYKNEFNEIYSREWESLLDLNVTLIESISETLGLSETEFVYSSDLPTEGEKTNRLLSVLKELGADEYISGPGAKDYIEQSKFEREGIDLYWHHFDHPSYTQPHGEFVSHLSAIDLLFTTGDYALSLICDGEADALKKAEEFDT